jgi:uncharacterized protein YcbX
VHVRELWIYPIKSCRGFRVTAARVVRRGLERDRRWMIVDEAGRFVTQRERPEMTLLRCALEGDALRVHGSYGSDLLIPAEPTDGTRVRVIVWKQEVEALVHEGASAWFSERLGGRFRAVFMPDDVLRPAKGQPAGGDVVAFADAYPLLAIGQASLDLLGGKLDAPIPMERFRPNVVIEGAPPHDEDHWVRGTIGEIAFRSGGRCVRCSVPTIDPESGERGKEPLATLATYRSTDGDVTFGVNLLVGASHDSREDDARVVRVGDEVVVHERAQDA